MDRRSFLLIAGVGTATASVPSLPVMAGPFPSELDSEHPIPLDKKLDADWVKSLYARGVPTQYRGWDELRFIGMPVGGIAAGTMYLGGDGQLWCWDIFNEHHEGVIPNTITDQPELAAHRPAVRERDGANYVKPTDEQWSPWKVAQEFLLRVGSGDATQTYPLNRHGFDDITFTGQYPVAKVGYRKQDCPVKVELEAFSPFIPLDTENSSFPATVLRYTVSNISDKPQSVSLVGYLENPTLRNHRGIANVDLKLIRLPNGFMGTAAGRATELPDARPREDILIADFEQSDWQDWQAQGQAFADGPFPADKLKPVQDSTGYKGKQFVNSYNTRVTGEQNPDSLTGELTSPTFKIQRKYINLLVGGGKQDAAFVEVLVDGKSVGKVTGHGNNQLLAKSIDTSTYEGESAVIRIVDEATGSWGQITVDHIVASDKPAVEATPVEQLPDMGSLALVAASSLPLQVGEWDSQHQSIARALENPNDVLATPVAHGQTGAAQVSFELAPGAVSEVVFILAWHYPNTHFSGRKRSYATHFSDAAAVAVHVANQVETLTRQTKLWRDTWYGGSLPNWLLERTLVTADTLQTNNAYRFADGEFWAWEGVGCCPGTCTHVWHYAQAVGRLFPELERDLRERTDYGRAFNKTTGAIGFRGSQAGRDATDGQAGVILRTYREHQVTGDDKFLGRVWPRCKQAIEFLISQDARDGELDGVPVGEQHNTLDAEWFGKVPVLTSLYLAALRAGQEMAQVVGDQQAAERFRKIYLRGAVNIQALFNADYGFYVQEEDVNHLDAIGVGDGCYIDQVMGQWWAFNLGLGRLYDGKSIRSALHRLWDYNFCPDVGRLRASIPIRMRGRPYALAGDAGLVMCTWPQGGRRDDWERHWQYGYFNECMTGFEYEAAGHMIWESQWDADLLQKGLAVTRAIHDRYHASMRNPYNEIECSDHYARAMASYGVFLAVCGFEYDGPQGHMGYAPRLNPAAFEAAFTAAEGWGAIAQVRSPGKQSQSISVRWGCVKLNTLAFECAPGHQPKNVLVKHGTSSLPATFELDATRVLITLSETATLAGGETLQVEIS